MDKITINKYPKRFWSVAEIFKNDVKIATVNLFFEVTDDWILIYKTDGHSGNHQKGDLEQKIFIGDCEVQTFDLYT